MLAARRAPWRRLLLRACGAGVLAFLVLELVLHLFVLPGYWRPLPPFGRELTPDQAQWVERQREELAGTRPANSTAWFDAELGWNNRPGTKDELVTIHAGGWRGSRDHPMPVPEGMTRIAAFGESFTFGYEVGDDDTWPAQLEALDAHLEVLNFGVGAYGTDQALLRAERELPGKGAEVVLVGLMLENIGRNVNRYRPLWMPQAHNPVAKPRFVLEGGALRLVPLPFRDRAEFVEAVASGQVVDVLREHEYWDDAAAPAWLAWSACARLFQAKRAYRARHIAGLWLDEGEPFHVTLALLARFRDLARELGARDAVVLVFPSRNEVDALLGGQEMYWNALLADFTRRGAPYLDLSPALLAEARARGTGHVYGIGHLSPAGNAVVARELHAWLAGWL